MNIYIRGKPWFITVDDYLLFTWDDQSTEAVEVLASPLLLFGQPKRQGPATADDMWAPMLEKAWAKIKGSYFNMDEGFVENTMRAIIGVPVYSYGDVETDAEVTSYF